jgi:hypothetical protein
MLLGPLVERIEVAAELTTFNLKIIRSLDFWQV